MPGDRRHREQGAIREKDEMKRNNTTVQKGPHSGEAGDSNDSPDCHIQRAV